VLPNSVNRGEQVTLDASLSFDAEGPITLYEWDTDGDGSFESSSLEPVHYFNANTADSFALKLRITDSSGATAQASALLHVHGFNPSYIFFDPAPIAGDHTSMALVNGRPAIAYYNSSLPSWDAPVPVDFSGNSGMFSSLAIVNGRPAISYYDSSTEDLMYVRALDADGAAWGAPLNAGAIADDEGPYTCLKIINGRPAISYQSLEANDLAYVRANDADGTSWGSRQLLATAMDSGWYSSMEVVNGLPGICFYDAAGTDLQFMQALDADGDSWGSIIGVDAGAGDTGAYCSLEVINGKPSIAYRNEGLDTLGYARAGNADGSNWIQGRPAIAYYDETNKDVRYLQALDAEGYLWPALPQIPDGQSDCGTFCCLIAVSGGPAISYFDDSFDDLRYVRGF
jgi:hypothetical protein